jgi:hypothetical protein
MLLFPTKIIAPERRLARKPGGAIRQIAPPGGLGKEQFSWK